MYKLIDGKVKARFEQLLGYVYFCCSYTYSREGITHHNRKNHVIDNQLYCICTIWLKDNPPTFSYIRCNKCEHHLFLTDTELEDHGVEKWWKKYLEPYR